MPIEISEISMPFETIPASLTVPFSKRIFPEKKVPDLLNLEMSLVDIERADSLLCALRANNISVIVNLKRDLTGLSLDKCVEAIVLLRDWDQLTLQNILILFGERFPETFRRKLEIESKIESKSFREWVVALQDNRLHQYPNLPWRSFIRKIVKENFAFILNCIQLWDNQSPDEAFTATFAEFIEAKKKVICVFPKKWDKSI